MKKEIYSIKGIRIFLFLLSLIGTINNSIAQQPFQLNAFAVPTTGEHCYQLTTATNNEYGSMWFRKKADLRKDFDITANLYFGNNTAGADGITFAFQNECTSSGVGGGGIGVGGVTPSLVVEFDTYQNPYDPGVDHIAIEKNGWVEHTGANHLAGPVSALANNATIKDGKFHPVRIVWTAADSTLKVYFDGAQRLSYTANIVKTIFSNDPFVYWGFTAATGGYNNQHIVCIESFPTNVVKLQDITICQGETAYPVIPGGVSYSWSPTTNIIGENTSNPQLFPDVTTKYVVSIADACNNIQKDSLVVTVNPKPNVSLNNFADICEGTPSFDLTGGSPNGGIYSGTGVSDNKFNSSVSGNGTFQITYTYTNNFQCTASAQQNITVFAKPVATLSAQPTLCINNAPITLTGGIPTGGVYSGIGVSGGKFDPTIAGAGTHTITYTYTDANGCTASPTQTLTVYNKPSASITSSNGSVICSGTAVVLNSPGTSDIKYQWLLNNVPQTSLSTSNTQFNATSTGDFALVAENTNGCSDTSTTFTVTTGTTPNASLTASTNSICPGDSVLLSTTLNTGETLEWLRNGNVIPSQNEMSYKTPIAGTYAVWVTNTSGCKAKSSDVIITLLEGPSATLSTARPAFCPEVTSITLTANNQIDGIYTWYKDELIINGISTSTYNATEAGSYKVKVALPNGCYEISNTVSLVTASNPVVTLSSSDNTFCTGSTVQLTASTINSAQYNWYKNNVKINGPVSSNQLNINEGGEYYAEAISNLGCSGLTNTLTIVEKSLPIATISANKTTICNEQSETITASYIPEATYEWFINNESLGVSSPGNNTLSITQAGTYYVIINDGCSATSNSIVMQESSLPGNVGTITGISSFCPGDDSKTFSVNTVAGAADYLWELSPSDKATISSGQGTNSIKVDFLNQNVSIKVTPRNACGTGNSSSKTVTVGNSFNCSSANASFGAYPTKTCIGSTVTFYNYTNATLPGTVVKWNFGSGASPATATGNGPHNVTYNNDGTKTVTLQYVDNFTGLDVLSGTKINYITISNGLCIPTSKSITGNTTVQPGETVTYTVSPAPSGSTYSWTLPVGFTIISSNADNSSITVIAGTTGGAIILTETNSAGSVSSSINVNVSTITTFEFDKVDFSSVVIRPNPFTEYSTVIIQSSITVPIKTEVFNSNGKHILTSDEYSTNQEINIGQNLKAGVYYMKVSYLNRTRTIKLIKL
ncbi:MAG TPA: T9SS type A sorting domain-containing protein [Cytophagaceae bacterium]